MLTSLEHVETLCCQLIAPDSLNSLEFLSLSHFPTAGREKLLLNFNPCYDGLFVHLVTLIKLPIEAWIEVCSVGYSVEQSSRLMLQSVTGLRDYMIEVEGSHMTQMGRVARKVTAHYSHKVLSRNA